MVEREPTVSSDLLHKHTVVCAHMHKRTHTCVHTNTCKKNDKVNVSCLLVEGDNNERNGVFKQKREWQGSQEAQVIKQKAEGTQNSVSSTLIPKGRRRTHSQVGKKAV